MSTDDVTLFVNGKRYEGWKSITVSRSIESIAASFDLDVSDKWKGQGLPWPIVEEDACRVEIGGEPVIDGYVDRRSPAYDEKSRSLSYGGKDKTAALVENSVVLDRWSFKNISLLDFAKTICDQFDIKVTLDPTVVLPRPAPAKTVVNPGEKAFEALERAARVAGVLLVSDSAGGLLITRSGVEKVTTPLVEGVNIKAASVDYDATSRYARYVVATQTPGSDKASGAHTRVRAEATDEDVRRSSRVLVIRPETGISTDNARRRADWEARVRAARAEAVSVTVRGWQDPDGALWPLNRLIPVESPSIGVDGELLIAAAVHTVDEGGRITKFRLLRPDAFTPEPIEAKVKHGSGGLWKDLEAYARGRRAGKGFF